MARHSRITAAGLAAEAAALQSGTQLTPTKVRFGTGRVVPTASTTGITTPFVPPKETSLLNFVLDGPSFELGYQYVGNDEFNFSELEVVVTGDVVHSVIVDDTGNLGGKNVSQIAMVGALELTYVNPPDASGLTAVLNAPLALLHASTTVRGAIAIATDAEAAAAVNDAKAVVPKHLAGSAMSPRSVTSGRLDALITDGFYTVQSAVLRAAPDKPAGVADGDAVIHRIEGHWQLLDANGNIFVKVGTGSWRQSSGRVPTVWRRSTPGNYTCNVPDDSTRAVIELKASGFGADGGFRDLGVDYPGRSQNRNVPNGYVIIDIPTEYLPKQCAVVVPSGGMGGPGSPSVSRQNGGSGTLASFNGWTSDLNYTLGRSSPSRGGQGGGGSPDGRIGFDVAAQPSPLPLIFGAGGAAGTSSSPNGVAGTGPSGNGGAGYGQNGRGGDGGPGEVKVTFYFA